VSSLGHICILTLTLAPLQPKIKPHDNCMHALNNCWLLDERQILESMIRGELSAEPYTLERIERIHFWWGFDTQLLVPGFHKRSSSKLCAPHLDVELVGFIDYHVTLALYIHMRSWSVDSPLTKEIDAFALVAFHKPISLISFDLFIFSMRTCLV